MSADEVMITRAEAVLIATCLLTTSLMVASVAVLALAEIAARLAEVLKKIKELLTR